ncbi:MAG: glucans biosynthesis glucosyltransferase MdoH [Terrimicrobiaceae bacterium]|nr:glucans biosynthesis glucosyltransferase MdoH [Terrimicrobiaceae bacterium]
MKPFANAAGLSPDVISLRQALFLATGGGLTICGILLMVSILEGGGFTPAEWVLLALFIPLFGQIAFGFTIAFWGFLVLALGGERYEIMRTLPETGEAEPPGSTAVILPVFNENPSRTFRGLENMVLSIGQMPGGKAFDFFVLSDSNEPDCWIREETKWFQLCSRLNAFGRIFYRKRRVSLHGKSGNVADFCRRWGKRYKYLLILDADSVMNGETMLRLARVMDANPGVGIVQTAPQIVRGRSVFQRLVQFATRSVGPLFAAGSNFWHLGSGNYWGHNAIIRLQPFMEKCVLPELPGRSAADRHILSHDTVEASLMKQAGYQVWFAYLEGGSYEEGPPNLTESLKRDRRWCQGNLQHFWFLFAPGTAFANRIHIFFGLMAYLTAPLLAAFIGLSAWDHYWKAKFEHLSALSTDPAWTGSGQASVSLLRLTLVLLFVPKILGSIHLLPRAREFGGILRSIISSLLEAVLSILLAPVLLYFYTRFVILILLGIKVGWKTQNREDSSIPFPDALRTYWGPTFAGAFLTGATLVWMPSLTLWLSPFLAGLVLSIPLAMWTSSEKAGRGLKAAGLLVIPEEMSPPAILENLEGSRGAASSSREVASRAGILELAISPEVNAIHASLLRRSRVHARHREEYLAGLRQRLLAEGPAHLSHREIMSLLWDAGAVELLHREIWLLEEKNLNPCWRAALRD